MQSTELFHSALLLVRHEDLAVLDRRALRDAGVRSVRVLSSGVAAARLLLEESSRRALMPYALNTGIEVVLCHDQLADMTGDEFVRLLRLHPTLCTFPVLVTVSGARGNMRAKAIEAGYSGFLVRPFPLSGLIEQLRGALAWRDSACSCQPKSREVDAGAFESALEYFVRQSLAQSENPDVVYRSGLSDLREGKWDDAISSLHRATKLNPGSGDILVALAAGWRGKGNRGKSDAMLQEAVAVFVENQNWNQAQLVSDRLIREYPKMVHPLQAAARRLVAKGKYDEAAQALIRDQTSQECAGEPGKKRVFEQVARGCFASPDPARAAEELAISLSSAGYHAFGQALERFVLDHIESGGLESLGNERALADFAIAEEPQLLLKDPLFTDSDAPACLSTPDVPKKLANKAVAAAPAHKKTVAHQVIAPLKEPNSSTALNGFPLLRDAVAVAKVTLGLFRSGRKRKR